MKVAGGTKVSGKVWIAQAGVQGTLTVYTQGSDRYATHMDFGKFGRIDTVANGSQAWSYTSMRGFNVLKGDMLTQALLAHPGAVECDWNDYFDSVEVVRNDTVNDRNVFVVRLEKGDLPSRTYYIDAEHGDVVRVKQIVIEGTIRIPVTSTFSDFEEVDGIRMPLRIEVENPASGKMVFTFEHSESGLELGAEAFTLEDPDAR